MIDEGARVDIHSHLVPGVDDGSRTLDDSLESIERMTRVGIRAILTTPHFNASILQVPEEAEARIEEVEEAFALLRDAAEDRFPEVHLMRGFEIMLDDPDPDLSDPRLRMDGTAFVLVEWPSMQVPPGTPAVLQRLRSQGYIPVIAHPERYHVGGSMVELGQLWKDAGAFLQVNHGSITGRYGGRVQTRGWDLLEAGLADYLASDHHGRPHLELQLEGVMQEVDGTGAEESIQALLRTNPRRLIDGEAPFPVRPIRASTGWKDRLKQLFNSSEAS